MLTTVLRVAELAATCLTQSDARGSASLSRDYTLTTTNLPEGEHTVDVIATDRAGNAATTQTLNVFIHRSTTPAPDFPDDPTDNPDADTAADYPGPDLVDACVPDFNIGVDDCLQAESSNSTSQDVYSEPRVSSNTGSPLLMGLTSQGFATRSSNLTAAIGSYAPPEVDCSGKSPGRWGFGDNKAGVWASARLQALQPSRARVTPGWDVVIQGEAANAGSDAYTQLQDLDNWMTETLKRCYEPLVSFEFSHIPGRASIKPDPYTDYKAAVLAFLGRYPFVHLFTPWNEPNHPRQPTEDDPETAGKWWRQLRSICATRSCTAIAGDLLDRNFNGPGLKLGTYLSRYKQAMGRRASAWAVHPYVTAAAHSGLDSRWKEFLRSTTCTACTTFPNPPVWITEVGGVVSFVASGKPRKIYGIADAATQVNYVLDLAKNEPRVSRFFYYNWTGGPTFDSGLIAWKKNPEGDPNRPSMQTRGSMYCPVFHAMRPGATSSTCP